MVSGIRILFGGFAGGLVSVSSLGYSAKALADVLKASLSESTFIFVSAAFIFTRSAFTFRSNSLARIWKAHG